MLKRTPFWNCHCVWAERKRLFFNGYKAMGSVVKAGAVGAFIVSVSCGLGVF